MKACPRLKPAWPGQEPLLSPVTGVEKAWCVRPAQQMSSHFKIGKPDPHASRKHANPDYLQVYR